MRGRSIAHRISVLVGSTVLLAVSLVTVVFVYSDITQDFDQRKRSIEATGYVFASAVADHMVSGDSEQSLRVLRSISRIPEVTYAAVLDAQGRNFASLGGAIVLDPESLRADMGIVTTLRNGIYPVAVDVIKSGETIGKVLLIADVSDLRRQLFHALITALSVSAVSVIISFAIARRLQRRITTPIRALTAAMLDVASTRSYDRKVEADAEGETGMLVDSFNAMISEVRARDLALERHRQTLESTVERRTAELRHARDAAESANEAKSSFLATMSHEIRTPLNGLMVMAELLAGAGLDQRLQRYAEVIVKSGQSLLTIINDILDLSKIEAGKLALEMIPVDPAAIADDVASLFWEKASSKKIDLAVRVSAGVPRTIMSDPVRLNQILSNLVNNALKFTDHGQVLVSLQQESGSLVLSVTDSGIGISQKKLNVLFEAFSQADQTITRRFGGTGLGLAICKRLAEAMGGTIGVKSRIGQGSTFWVKIPVTAADKAPRYRKFRPVRAGLAIEGLATQSAFGTAIAASGLSVTPVQENWEDFDVVFATAAQLRTMRTGGRPRPIVICLGWIGDSEGEAAIAGGIADDLVILPVRQHDIADMLDRIENGRLRGKAVLDRTGTALQQVTFTGRKVLVADDNAVNREVIIEVLRQLDVTVHVAVNGVEAVEAWRKEKPDLVFMDCSMPEMDGFTATREIRAHEALAIVPSHTPVVALTAHMAGVDGDTWREAGMDAYLTKPFTLNQIVSCLSAHFRGLAPPAEEPVAREPRGAILDEAVLQEIRNIGGNDALFRRVLDLFAGRVPQAVDKVNASAKETDLQQLADAAHALKSMCANIGATRAVEACDQLEAAARQGTGVNVGAMAADISREVALVLREVDRLRVA